MYQLNKVDTKIILDDYYFTKVDKIVVFFVFIFLKVDKLPSFCHFLFQKRCSFSDTSIRLAENKHLPRSFKEAPI